MRLHTLIFPLYVFFLWLPKPLVIYHMGWDYLLDWWMMLWETDCINGPTFSPFPVSSMPFVLWLWSFSHKGRIYFPLYGTCFDNRMRQKWLCATFEPRPLIALYIFAFPPVPLLSLWIYARAGLLEDERYVERSGSHLKSADIISWPSDMRVNSVKISRTT